MTNWLRWIVPAEWATERRTGRRLFAPPADNDSSLKIAARQWKPLFDGKTLDGWTATGNQEAWLVEDGAIVCTGRGGGYLRTVDQYENFALAFEASVDKGVNSGVFVRWSDLRDPVNTGIEVQLLDSAGKQKTNVHDSGAIYDLVAPAPNTMRPAGAWNRFVITCSGPFVSVRMNGTPVSEINLGRYTQPGRNPDGGKNKFRYALAGLPRRGYIGLQDHGGRARFRSLRLLPLR